MSCPFHGSLVALPTPFAGEGIDFEAFGRWIDLQVEAGSDGIVVGGTTGEAATLSERERRALFRASVERAAGRLVVIAGVGTNDTRASVEMARFAADCGATALMAVTPYYNRPGPRGLMAHFGSIADACDLPLMLYNVPSRTGTDLEPELARAIAERHANVVALKEANGSSERVRTVAERSGLAVFGGEDAVLADFMRHGAVGSVSVVGNLLPGAVAELVHAALAADHERAAELGAQLAPLVRDLFIEVNPVPVKAALALTTGASPDVRLPLVGLAPESRRRLVATLQAAGLEATVGG